MTGNQRIEASAVTLTEGQGVFAEDDPAAHRHQGGRIGNHREREIDAIEKIGATQIHRQGAGVLQLNPLKLIRIQESRGQFSRRGIGGVIHDFADHQIGRTGGGGVHQKLLLIEGTPRSCAIEDPGTDRGYAGRKEDRRPTGAARRGQAAVEADIAGTGTRLVDFHRKGVGSGVEQIQGKIGKGNEVLTVIGRIA